MWNKHFIRGSLDSKLEVSPNKSFYMADSSWDILWIIPESLNKIRNMNSFYMFRSSFELRYVNWLLSKLHHIKFLFLYLGYGWNYLNYFLWKKHYQSCKLNIELRVSPDSYFFISDSSYDILLWKIIDVPLWLQLSLI